MKRGKHTTPNSRRSRSVWPFFTALAVLTVVAFILPLRPTKSYSEKRALAEFPDFSVEALLSGDYFDGISTWFSDTFPGRETWLLANARVEELHGISDIAIYGDLPVSNPVPSVPPVPTAQPTPLATPVPEENAAPAETPEPTPVPTPAPVMMTAPPETSIEEWNGIRVDDEADVIFGTTLQVGNAAYGYFPFLQDGCDTYARIVRDFAAAVADKGVTVYCMPIPTSVGVMLSSKSQEKVQCADQGAAIAYTLGCLDDNVKKVNVFNNLVSHNNEYLYFRTDHHWTQLGAYYAYETFCGVAGIEPVKLSHYTKLDEGEFRGSFFYNCYQNSRLKVDDLVAYIPPGDIEMLVTTDGGWTFPCDIIKDLSAGDPTLKYLSFLAGDYPLITVHNHDLPDGPVCLVVKDSFGNTFTPYLSQHYSTIYVTDYRYYKTMGLRSFVDAYNVDDVVFCQCLALAETVGVAGLTEYLCR